MKTQLACINSTVKYLLHIPKKKIIEKASCENFQGHK